MDAVAGTACRILDTRKTMPGLRTAQKYAVRCGGGSNHRIGLYDLVLIKENHIAAAGSIAAAVAAARRAVARRAAWKWRPRTSSEFDQALAAGADVIMLDDFSLEDMRTRGRAQPRAAAPRRARSLRRRQPRALRDIAATGVDCISIGALTKHVRAIDLSMRFDAGTTARSYVRTPTALRARAAAAASAACAC